MSFLYTIPQFSININRSEETNGDENLNFGAMVIGLAVDMNVICELPSFISSGRIGLGLSANADGSLVKVNDIDPRTHNYVRYGREAQKAVILAGFGLGFLDDMFGVGVGANISFGGEGVVSLDEMAVQSDTQYPEAQAKMDLSASPSPVAGLYFSPGKITSILDGLEVGASYRYESYMEIYPFDTAARIPSVSTVITMAMLVSIYDYYQPHIITAGVAYDLGKITPIDLTISIDGEYQLWSKYAVSRTAKIYYEGLYADFFPELNDAVVIRSGFEYQLFDWLAIRAGYYFQFSFIPDGEMDKEVNFLDNDKHVGSLGAKFDLPQMGPLGGPIEITFAYQFQYLVPRSVTKSATYVSALNPNYSYDGMCHTAILGVSMKI
ncbi:MAG: hypothetical protein GY754_21145 [bacterium]|nr:hypothetical protein [bacterium]